MHLRLLLIAWSSQWLACGSVATCNDAYYPETFQLVMKDGAFRVGISFEDTGSYAYTCDAPTSSCEVVRESEGYRLPPRIEALDGKLAITVVGVPKTVHVTVDDGANRVFERDVRPDYKETEPNGEGCGPVRKAVVNLELP